MIRAHKKETTLQEIAPRFGMSVPTCVRVKRAFREGGLQALIPAPRGARGPRKITAEMLEFADHYRAEHGHVSIRKLAELVSAHFGVRVHFSSLHRALSKKTLRQALMRRCSMVRTPIAVTAGASGGSPTCTTRPSPWCATTAWHVRWRSRHACLRPIRPRSLRLRRLPMMRCLCTLHP